MRKIILMVAMLLLSSTLLFSNANASPLAPMYIGIDSIQVNLSINGSGNASCSARVDSSSSSYMPSLSATLKKSQDGKTWIFVASWSATGTYLTGANISKQVTVSSGYQYKLFIAAKVHNSSGALIETAYKNSAAVSYW